MTTAVDSSVLIAIGNGEPGHEAWQEVLDQAAQEGALTICPIVLAELSARYRALDLLAGPAFADAFANSTDQRDYRWGKLHRIVFDHPFIDAFSIPAQPPQVFPQPVPGLRGIPTDGGFNVVDASSHSARADSVNGFMFGSGPVRRYVSEPQAAYRSGAAPLAAVEGFIRQILGWREYIWQLYWHFGPDYLGKVWQWLANDQPA